MKVARVSTAAMVTLAFMAATAEPASAKIVKTKQHGELALVLGSGLEYQGDGEQSEYGFPFIVEYGPSDALRVTLEPSYVSARDKTAGRTIQGIGDFETTLTWEFLPATGSRPSLAVEGTVKWPTAKHDEFGTGKTDYAFGAIISKEFARFDLDLEGIYTIVGDPPGADLRNTTDLSLAAEWHLGSFLDLEAEALTSTGTGPIARPLGAIGGFGGLGASRGGVEAEGTLGLAEHLTDYLKLEEGIIYGSGGSWEAVAAWEVDFAGR